MTEIPFHATPMGARYFESTVPALVRELQRLNANLERLADLQVRVGDQQQPQDKETERDEDLHEEDPRADDRRPRG